MYTPYIQNIISLCNQSKQLLMQFFFVFLLLSLWNSACISHLQALLMGTSHVSGIQWPRVANGHHIGWLSHGMEQGPDCGCHCLSSNPAQLPASCDPDQSLGLSEPHSLHLLNVSVWLCLEGQMMEYANGPPQCWNKDRTGESKQGPRTVPGTKGWHLLSLFQSQINPSWDSTDI